MSRRTAHTPRTPPREHASPRAWRGDHAATRHTPPDDTTGAHTAKVCELFEQAEEDLLAFYRFPAEHWTKLRSTKPLERVNKEIRRDTDVVRIFLNDQAVIRLAGALLIEQNDEWLVSRRYLSAESIALIRQDVDSEQDSLQPAEEVGSLAAG
jgi:hypothetical protein